MKPITLVITHLSLTAFVMYQYTQDNVAAVQESVATPPPQLRVGTYTWSELSVQWIPR